MPVIKARIEKSLRGALSTLIIFQFTIKNIQFINNMFLSFLTKICKSLVKTLVIDISFIIIISYIKRIDKYLNNMIL